TFKNCLTFSKVETAPTANVGGFIGYNAQTAANIALSTYTDCAWLYNSNPAQGAFGSASAVGADNAGVMPIGVMPRSAEVLTGESKELVAREAVGYTLSSWSQTGGTDFVGLTQRGTKAEVTAKKADGASVVTGVFKRTNYPDVAVNVPVTTGSKVVTISTWDEFAAKVADGGQYVQTCNITAPAGITAYQIKTLLSGSYDGGGFTIDVGAIPSSAWTKDAEGNAGLFGKIGGSVQNLTLTGVRMGTDAAAAGGLAGTVTGTAVINGVRVEGNISSVGALSGMLAGKIETGASITGVGTTGTMNVTGSGKSGGFAGSIATGVSINNSFAYVKYVEATANTGGFVGELADGAVITNGIWSAAASGAAVKAVGMGAASAGVRPLRIAPSPIALTMGGSAAVTLNETDADMAALGLAVEKWTVGTGLSIKNDTLKTADVKAALTETPATWVALKVKDTKIKADYDAAKADASVAGAIPIGNVADLKKVGSGERVVIGGKEYVMGADSVYVQTRDIAINENWTSLPTFGGTYNGAGYSVTFTKQAGAGLFDKLVGTAERSAEVSGLKLVLTNAQFTGEASGALAGSAQYAVINNVGVTGTAGASAAVLKLGGIAGTGVNVRLRLSGSSANLTLNDTVARKSFVLGGIFGSASVVNMDGCYAGGILIPDAAVINEADKTAGGIIGMLTGAGSSIKNTVTGVAINNSVAIQPTNLGAFMGKDMSAGTVYDGNIWSAQTCNPKQAFGTGSAAAVHELALSPSEVVRKQGQISALNLGAPMGAAETTAQLAFEKWTSTGAVGVTFDKSTLPSTTATLADKVGAAQITANYVSALDSKVKLAYVMPVTVSENTAPVITNVTQMPEGAARYKQVTATVTDAGGSSLKEVYLATSATAQTGMTMSASGAVDGYTVRVNENGTYYIIAVDNAGNRAFVSVAVTNIDSVPPTIGSVTQNADNTLSAVVTDVGSSGISRVFAAKTQTADSGIVMSLSAAKDTYVSDRLTENATYYVIAVDGAGNRSFVEKVVTGIDLTPPAVTDAKQEPTGAAASKTISAKVADIGGSGIANVYYLSTNDATAKKGVPMSETVAGSGIYTSGAIVKNGTYYIFAVDGAGNRSVNAAVNVTGITTETKIISLTQTPEGWSKDSKSVTATVEFAGTAVSTTVKIGKTADGVGAVDMTKGAGNTYTATVTEGGVWYVFANDVTNSLLAEDSIEVKLDKAAPTVTAALTAKNTLLATGEDKESGVAGMWYADNAALVNPVALTLKDGAYVSAVLTENKSYYVYATDVAGNTSTAIEVKVVLNDTTPPQITDVKLLKSAQGYYTMRCTVQDIASGNEPASGVKQMMWKQGASGTYALAEPVVGVAGAYDFAVGDPSLQYFVKATDNAGNESAEKEAIDSGYVINITLPSKLMFASLPNVHGASFIAPQYKVTNNSVNSNVEVSLQSVTQNVAGFTLTAGAPTKDSMNLWIQQSSAPGAFGFAKTQLTSPLSSPVVLGTLDKMGGAHPVGGYTFAGDVYRYSVVEAMQIQPKRAGFDTVFRVENVRAN
ncbi:MAG: hypothetical protein RSA41_04105, partial [Christensenella sp.]